MAPPRKEEINKPQVKRLSPLKTPIPPAFEYYIFLCVTMRRRPIADNNGTVQNRGVLEKGILVIKVLRRNVSQDSIRTSILYDMI